MDSHQCLMAIDGRGTRGSWMLGELEQVRLDLRTEVLPALGIGTIKPDQAVSRTGMSKPN